ncbi:MAG: hypothetical protein LBB93_04730 [Elusimicrobiota bacterium]|jgi:hypothetical protein|nr:hypothetical protein [Elusimicrobiota bacterium]
MKKILLSMVFVFGFTSMSFAITAIKLSLWDTIAAPSDQDVTGFELGIGAKYRELHGGSFNFLYSEIETVKGVQIGAVNRANSVKGAQLGFVNITDNMHGVQVGLINVINNSPVLKVMILFNAQF